MFLKMSQPAEGRPSFRVTGARLCGLVALCSGVVLLSGCEQEQEAVIVTSPKVRVASVRRADVSRQLRWSGTIEAERSVVLSFPVVGTVAQVLVEEGQIVKRGQVIARLQSSSYQDALGIAKAKSNQAEDAYRRLKPMAENKTLPEIKLVEVESGLAQARLSVSLAAKNVQDSVLRAPENGLVAKRSVEPGASVAPGVPIITVMQTDTVLAAAPVPETQIAQIRKGWPGHRGCCPRNNAPFANAGGKRGGNYDSNLYLHYARDPEPSGRAARNRVASRAHRSFGHGRR